MGGGYWSEGEAYRVCCWKKSAFALSLRKEYSDRGIARASYDFTFWPFYDVALSVRMEYSHREIARASYSFTFWLFIM